MPAKDNYYHFPICLLANIQSCDDRKTFNQILDQIAAWTCEHVGRAFVEKESKKPNSSFIEGRAMDSDVEDFDLYNEDHLNILWGAETIGEKIDSYKETTARLQQARKFVDDWEVKHGEHLHCRIRTDIFRDARRKPKSLSLRDFLSLCGLYATIGDAPFKQITLERIYYAASGCKSKRVFDQLERAATLTSKQVRGAIDKLYYRNLFATVTYKKRFKFYSNRLEQAELKKRVMDHFLKQAEEKASKKRDREISADDLDSR